MRYVRAVGPPLGIVAGVLTGAEREQAGVCGMGTAEFGPCVGEERIPAFWMRVWYFEVWPGVTVICGNQRNRVPA